MQRERFGVNLCKLLQLLHELTGEKFESIIVEIFRDLEWQSYGEPVSFVLCRVIGLWVIVCMYFSRRAIKTDIIQMAYTSFRSKRI